jgi:hypothetical protein
LVLDPHLMAMGPIYSSSNMLILFHWNLDLCLKWSYVNPCCCADPNLFTTKREKEKESVLFSQVKWFEFRNLGFATPKSYVLWFKVAKLSLAFPKSFTRLKRTVFVLSMACVAPQI